MESSPWIVIVYESYTILSNMASAKVPSPILEYQAAVGNWEQNIVDATLCRDSTISKRSLASLSVSGTRHHSSIIN